MYVMQVPPPPSTSNYSFQFYLGLEIKLKIQLSIPFQIHVSSKIDLCVRKNEPYNPEFAKKKLRDLIKELRVRLEVDLSKNLVFCIITATREHLSAHYEFWFRYAIL